MKKMVIGVVLAAVAMFAWGIVFWGFSGLPWGALQKPVDTATVGPDLLEQFPEAGTYMIPNPSDPQEQTFEAMKSGPVAIVHMTKPNGTDPMNPMMMVKGFGLEVIFCIILAMIIRSSHAKGFVGRFMLGMLAAGSGVLLVEAGEPIWWNISIDWAAMRLAYSIIAVAIASAVLAAMLKPTSS